MSDEPQGLIYTEADLAPFTFELVAIVNGVKIGTKGFVGQEYWASEAEGQAEQIRTAFHEAGEALLGVITRGALLH